jgi:uncharacterized protein (TIGR00369 family)
MNDREIRTEITDADFEYAANMLQTVPFARLVGMELAELRMDEAVVRIAMRDDFRQLNGVLHGGVTATLIDTAMAFAIRTRLDREDRTATIDLTVHYLRPHVEGVMLCTAKVVRAGKRIFTVSAEVHNEDGTLIATGLSTYTRV